MRLVRALAFLASILLVSGRGGAAAQEPDTVFQAGSVTVDGLTIPVRVYVPPGYTPALRWPAILFLHGAGERGDDGVLQTTVGLGPAILRDPQRFPAIAVFPQAPADSAWTGTTARAALAALDSVARELAVDPERVYLTGISLGGHGAWSLAYREAERFAAVVPICGWVEEHPRFPQAGPAAAAAPGAELDALARRLVHMPIWIFHGALDQAVPVEQSRAAAAALDAIGGNVRYTELPGAGHNAWDPAYSFPELTRWLFAQRRGG